MHPTRSTLAHRFFALLVAATLLFIVANGAARLVFTIPPPAAAAQAGCTPQQAKTARDSAITTTELVCVMNSTLIGDVEIAKACDIAQELLPVIRNLARVRDGARRSGIVWADGGAP